MLSLSVSFLAPLVAVAGSTGPASAAAPAEGTRIVVVGHLYPLVDTPDRLERVLAAIDSEEAQHVFVLGDSGLEDPATFALFEAGLRAEVHYVPGNHELTADHRDAYFENVGYTEKAFSSVDAHFLLINSSESAEHTEDFVANALAELEADRPTLLMTHHRIWDDTLMSAEPYQHDKSYPFAALYPLLEKRVNAIFAGNSKRQYFRDLRQSGKYGPQNLNNVYWCDLVGPIACYSAGAGDCLPKTGYLVVDIEDGQLWPSPRSVLLEGGDPPALELVQPVRKNPFFSEAEERRLTRRMWLRYGGAGFVLGLLIGGTAFLLRR